MALAKHLFIVCIYCCCVNFQQIVRVECKANAVGVQSVNRLRRFAFKSISQRTLICFYISNYIMNNFKILTQQQQYVFENHFYINYTALRAPLQNLKGILDRPHDLGMRAKWKMQEPSLVKVAYKWFCSYQQLDRYYY